MKVEFQMAKKKSTKLTLEYRGGKIQFGRHATTGQYRKKYKGTTLWLGDDPAGVLDQWLVKTDQIDDDLKNSVVVDPEAVTIDMLCNEFLNVKLAMVENDELSRETYRNYHSYAKRIIEFFGLSTLIEDLTDDDFRRFRVDLSKPKPQKIAGQARKRLRKKTLSLVGLKTKIRHVKVIFNHAVDKEYLTRVPWRPGTFAAPSQKSIEKQKNKDNKTKGKRPKQATRDEIKAILGQCDATWTALVLLALNSGSGNTDCGMLRWDDIDADGWIENPRNKNQVERRFKLWPETIEALKPVRERHDAKGYTDGLVFHGRQGGTFVPKGKTNHVSRRFTELTKNAGVRRENLTFYSLRHTFQNVADETFDFPAVQYVMGHSQKSMSDNYRGQPSDERLEAVTLAVRDWFMQAEK